MNKVLCYIKASAYGNQIINIRGANSKDYRFLWDDNQKKHVFDRRQLILAKEDRDKANKHELLSGEEWNLVMPHLLDSRQLQYNKLRIEFVHVGEEPESPKKSGRPKKENHGI